MTDVELMQLIQAKYGAAIDAVCHASSVPAAFLAALVANESDGDANAKRFEPGVLAALWQVLLGRTAAYGSIGGQDLRVYLLPGEMAAPIALADVSHAFGDSLERLDGLATSWGLTQIMGYEIFAFSAGVPSPAKLVDLTTPSGGLALTVKMLAQFAQRWDLDLGSDFGQLFDCWNTGRPHKSGAAPDVPQPTADPDYIPKGLARMQIYQGLS
jgi:hypothetical protein